MNDTGPKLKECYPQPLRNQDTYYFNAVFLKNKLKTFWGEQNISTLKKRSVTAQLSHTGACGKGQVRTQHDLAFFKTLIPCPW